MNIYSVRSSYRTEGRKYNTHRTDNVVATDISDAITHVKRLRPLAHIWTVAHKGSIDPLMISDEAMDDIGGREETWEVE